MKEAEQTLTSDEILDIFHAKFKDLDIVVPEDLDELQMFEMFKKQAMRRCTNRKVDFHDVRKTHLFILLVRSRDQFC